MRVPTSRVAIVAVILLIVSAGILYPIHGKISTLEDEVAQLDQQREADEPVPMLVKDAHDRVMAMRDRIQGRAYHLCPSTPEAQQELERTVMDHVMNAGLDSIRMDSGAEVRTGPFPYRTFDLVVEGDANALRSFLVDLETMPWVTRVLRLSVEQGDDTRRISLQIAVMLESKS